MAHNITNVDMYNEITSDDMDVIFTQLLPHLFQDMEHPGCITTDYKTGPSGRPQISYRGTKYYISVLLALNNMRKRYPDYKLVPGFEGSHWKCNNPPCVNEKHLVLEMEDVNKSRLCCKIYGKFKNYRCPHLPVCPGCDPI